MTQINDNIQQRYIDENTRMFVWLVVLLVGWVLNKSLATFSPVPPDAVIEWNNIDTMNDLQTLIVYGIVQGWLIDITNEMRFNRLFSTYKKNWWIYGIYICSGPSFGGLSYTSIPGITSNTDCDSTCILVYISLGLVVLVLYVWHIRYAFKISATNVVNNELFDIELTNLSSESQQIEEERRQIVLQPNRKYFWMYLTTRMCIVGYFVMRVVLVEVSDDHLLHLHHWLVAWLLSLFCQFDHSISKICLAICTGIFVQGCAVYHVESMSIGKRYYMWSWKEYGYNGMWLQCIACGEGDWGTCASTCPIPDPNHGHNALSGACRALHE